MGKAKKFKPSQIGKNIALADQIESVNSVKNKNRVKQKNRHDDDEEVNNIYFFYLIYQCRRNLIFTLFSFIVC